MTPQSRTDFEITIRKYASGFWAEVKSPVGEADLQFRLPFSPRFMNALLNEYRTSMPRIREPAVATSSDVTVVSGVPTPTELGTLLFDTLFRGDVLEQYRKSRTEAESARRPLRIILAFPEEEPTIMSLPWEFMYDKERRDFLAFNQNLPVIRRIPVKTKPFTYDPPIRVLIVMANPWDSARLNLQREHALIKKKLQELNKGRDKIRVKVELLASATQSELRQVIRDPECTPHVIHFMGHGGLDTILLDDKEGWSEPFSGQSLAIVLRNAPSLRLVVLNACKTGQNDIMEKQLGVAQQLASAGVPAVIAMQFAISDPAAAVFSEELYQVIVEGYPIDMGVTWGRIALHGKQKSKGLREWGTPVLYLQKQSGHILEDLLGGKPKDYKTPQRTNEVTQAGEKRAGRGEYREKQPREPHEPAPGDKEQVVKITKYVDELCRVGNEAYDREDWSQAIKCLSKAQKLSPTLAANKDTEAKLKKAFNEYVDKTSLGLAWYKTLEHNYTTAKSLMAKGNWEEAASFLEFIVENYAGYRDAYELAQKAHKEAARVKAEHRKQERLRELYDQAQKQMKDKNWTAAVEALEQIVSVQSDYEGENGKATDLLNKARKQRDLQENYDRGIELFNQSKWARAVEAFGKVVSIAPDYLDASEYLEKSRRERQIDLAISEARDYINNGNWEDAIEALEPVAGEREEAKIHLEYAQARHHISREEWAQAVEKLRNVMTGQPNYPGVAELYGKTRRRKEIDDKYREGLKYMETKQWYDAKIAFELVFDMTGENLQQHADARQQIEKAKEEIALASLYERARRAMARKRWEEALKLLQKIMDTRPDYEDVREKLKEVDKQRKLAELYTQGLNAVAAVNWKEAKACFSKIVGIDPGYRDAQEKLTEADGKIILIESYEAGTQTLEKGVKEHDLEKLKEAIRYLEKAEAQSQDYRDTAQQLARARKEYRLLSRYEDGEKALVQGKRTHSEKKLKEAIQALSQIVEEEGEAKYRDGKARELLEEARRQVNLLRLYEQSQESMRVKDWDETIQSLNELLEIDGEYRDTSKLLEKAKKEQRLGDLYDKAQELLRKEEWGKAIEKLETIVNAEPEYEDAKDLLDDAKHNQDILKRYEAGMAALKREKWEQATKAFEYVYEKEPEYKDVTTRLDYAIQQRALSKLYKEGMAALEAREWDTAVKKFIMIQQVDTNYGDAKEQLREAEHQKKLKEMFEKADDLLDKGKWAAAAKAFKEIEDYEQNYRQPK